MKKKKQNATLEGVQKSVDELAMITARGFAEVATKKELQELRQEMKEEFGEINVRLNTVEALLASNRIERLEDRMRQVLTHLKLG